MNLFFCSNGGISSEPNKIELATNVPLVFLIVAVRLSQCRRLHVKTWAPYFQCPTYRFFEIVKPQNPTHPQSKRTGAGPVIRSVRYRIRNMIQNMINVLKWPLAYGPQTMEYMKSPKIHNCENPKNVKKHVYGFPKNWRILFLRVCRRMKNRFVIF